MWIFHNLLYKAVALFVACLLWASAQGIRSVEESLDVPIQLVEIPDEVVVVDQSATEINLRIVGSRAAVRRAERQIVRFPMSARGLKPGEARLAVELERLTLPRGARVTARSPSSVTLQIDALARKRVPVRADLVGEVPPGYRMVGVEVEPEEIVLEGAQQELRKIREVLTDRIELGTLSGPMDAEVRLVLGSAHVWRVDDESPVRVRVRVEPLQGPQLPPGATGTGTMYEQQQGHPG